jgi:hypothetical protein
MAIHGLYSSLGTYSWQLEIPLGSFRGAPRISGLFVSVRVDVMCVFTSQMVHGGVEPAILCSDCFQAALRWTVSV